MASIEVKRFSRAQSLIAIKGDIDETFEPESLAQGASEGVTVIDLAGTPRITSYGVRQWQRGLRAMRSSYYCFIRCGQMLVWQFNLISGFGGRGELVSLYLPYVCGVCERESTRLLDLRHEYVVAASLDLGEFLCPACGSRDTEFDDLPEEYLEYVRSSAPPRPPSLADEIIDGSLRPHDARFRVEKTVDGKVTGFWMSGLLDGHRWSRRLSQGLQGDVVVIAADVTGATDAGIGALIDLLSSPGGRFFLARFPRPLWPAARRIASSRETARLMSVVLPFHCTSCERSTRVPLHRAGVEKLRGGARLRCAACGMELRPEFDRSGLEEALALPLAAAPREIAAYLGRHPPGAHGERRGSAAERYEVIESLGAGGMGRVFLARKLGIGGFEKTVVIKVVRGGLANKRKYVDMFLNEARLAARLSHPNIIQTFDVGVSGEQYFLVMEFVRGADLAKLITISKRLERLWPIELCCTVASDVCNGLWAAHSYETPSGRPSPIIHRDVAPDNILLSNDGGVKLTDFGLARLADAETTGLGGRIGKTPYMPPEVVYDGAPFDDPRCDVYSVGVLLHEMLTFQDPFASGLPPETRPLPRAVEEIVARARARSPEERFASARELQDRLDEVLRTELGGRLGPAEIGQFVRDLSQHDSGAVHRARTLDTGERDLESLVETELEFAGEEGIIVIQPPRRS